MAQLKTILKTAGEVDYIIQPSNHMRGFNRIHPEELPKTTFDPSTRTFTIEPGDGQTSFKFYVHGQLFTKTEAMSKTWNDATGSYLYYLDEQGDLQMVSKADAGQYLEMNAICGVVYWNKETQLSIIQAEDELHGIVMDGATHRNLHLTVGTKWGRIGGVANGFVDGDSTYTSISEGLYLDEDIDISIPEVTSIPFIWLEGDITGDGGWRESTPDLNVGYIASGDSYISINTHVGNVYGLTESTNSSDFVIYFILATNDRNNKYKMIVGQNAYANRNAAREALSTEALGIELLGLPGAEFKLAYAYICKRNGDLEDDGNGNALVDLRLVHNYNLI